MSRSAVPKCTRRAFIAGALALAGCGRRLATRYPGWLFVADRGGKSIAVADLSEFKRTATITLQHAPEQLIVSGNQVFAMCPEGAEIVRIDPFRASVAGRIRIPGRPISMSFRAGAKTGLVLTDAPPALLAVDPDKGDIRSRVALPALPAGFDASNNVAAVTLPTQGAVAAVDLASFRIKAVTDLQARPSVLRFRPDGRTILTGTSNDKKVVVIDTATGRLLARLPLSIVPERFCFNWDGGQMFVTGAGQDAVAIISPYQNEVDQTILAGRTPCEMAATANQLFVTNPESGDLTIIDIDTRRLSASVHVGQMPGPVLLTPDGEYAFVLNRQSGNVAVVRVRTVLDHKNRTKPLFTVIPAGPDPVSAVIVPQPV